jgi:hypothetical protein
MRSVEPEKNEPCPLHPEGGCVCKQYKFNPPLTFGDCVNLVGVPFAPGSHYPTPNVVFADVGSLERRVTELEKEVTLYRDALIGARAKIEWLEGRVRFFNRHAGI